MLGRDGSETHPHTTHGDARARTLAPTSLCSPPRYNCRTMADWARRLGLSREALINSARTAVATVASLLLALSLKLPEFYWAPISTIVILLSTINPADTRLAALCGDRFRRGPRRADRHIFQAQLDGVWHRHFCLRNGLLVLTPGERLSFCRDHAERCAADRAPASAVGSSLLTGSWKYRWELLWRCWPRRRGVCRGRRRFEDRAWRIRLPDL